MKTVIIVGVVERCTESGNCYKLAGENIELYFLMKVDKQRFKNFLP